jgi:hypothetical protein
MQNEELVKQQVNSDAAPKATPESSFATAVSTPVATSTSALQPPQAVLATDSKTVSTSSSTPTESKAAPAVQLQSKPPVAVIPPVVSLQPVEDQNPLLKNRLINFIQRQILRLEFEALKHPLIIDPKKVKAWVQNQIDLDIAKSVKALSDAIPINIAEQDEIIRKLTLAFEASHPDTIMKEDREEALLRARKIATLQLALAQLNHAYTPSLVTQSHIDSSLQEQVLNALINHNAELIDYTEGNCKTVANKLDKLSSTETHQMLRGKVTQITGNAFRVELLTTAQRERVQTMRPKAEILHVPAGNDDLVQSSELLAEMINPPQESPYFTLHFKRHEFDPREIKTLSGLMQLQAAFKTNNFEVLEPDPEFSRLPTAETVVDVAQGKPEEGKDTRANYIKVNYPILTQSISVQMAMHLALNYLITNTHVRYGKDLQKEKQAQQAREEKQGEVAKSMHSSSNTEEASLVKSIGYAAQYRYHTLFEEFHHNRIKPLQDKRAVLEKISATLRQEQAKVQVGSRFIADLLDTILIKRDPQYAVLWQSRNFADPTDPSIIARLKELQAVFTDPSKLEITATGQVKLNLSSDFQDPNMEHESKAVQKIVETKEKASKFFGNLWSQYGPGSRNKEEDRSEHYSKDF